MMQEESRFIITSPDVKPLRAFVTRLRMKLEERSAISTLKKLEDKEKRAVLNFDRISNFLGPAFEPSRIVVIPKASLEKVTSMKLSSGESVEALYNSAEDYIIVFFTPEESNVSIEGSIVHESIHRAGLVINAIDKDSASRLSVIQKRVGFALMGEGARRYNGPRSGDVLEELPACYANLLYLRLYAGEKYKEQVAEVFENKSISGLLRNLGEENTILASNLQPMEVDSLFAIIFEAILIGIGIPKEMMASEIIRSILGFRRSASGIREFIKRVEAQFGRGAYSKIRRIDKLNNEISAGELQEIIDLVRPYINLKNSLALSATIET